MSDDQTLAVYARRARDYAKLQPDAPFETLSTFVARLPEGARSAAEAAFEADLRRAAALVAQGEAAG